MKTYRNIIATALTLAFITASGVAFAQGHGMMGGMGNMTPEHQATMQKIHADFNAATADLNKQLFAKESELNAALYAEKPDEKKVDALTKEIGELNAKIYSERVKMQKAMAKEGIMPGKGGCQMMGGGMMGGMQHGGMMGGGMMGGMQHGMTGNGTAGHAPAAGHGAHGAPAQQ